MYSTMKTVRHAICGPKLKFQISPSSQGLPSLTQRCSVVWQVIHTKVFHIDSTLLTQARPVDGYIFGIRNQTAIAAFGNS